MQNTKNVFGDAIEYVDKMYNALDNAEALIICTEWNAFRTPDFNIIKSKLKKHLIFDGRNLFALEEMEKLNIEYHSIGRKIVKRQ
ncbi:UDP-glucose 6-dehydrogenase TuaD [bioreactor metagenome]|uniref:UDP-glucose 6-dehydrogenase TuaD n=1 Tax=bioreactor metagenome TaxID=1076179 RepID=A0A645D769_9ZZZZ